MYGCGQLLPSLRRQKGNSSGPADAAPAGRNYASMVADDARAAPPGGRRVGVQRVWHGRVVGQRLLLRRRGLLRRWRSDWRRADHAAIGHERWRLRFSRRVRARSSSAVPGPATIPRSPKPWRCVFGWPRDSPGQSEQISSTSKDNHAQTVASSDLRARADRS